MISPRPRRILAAALASALLVGSAAAVPGDYLIVNLGVLDPDDGGSQANAVSPLGAATGRSLGSIGQAFTWTETEGTVALPGLPGFPYAAGNGINDLGQAVGTAAATVWGSDPRPVLWQAGEVIPLPLPSGHAVGRAEGLNGSGLAVGSVGGGIAQQGALFTEGSSSVVNTLTPEGCTVTTFFAVNDAGLAVGTGNDPDDAARNVGFVYDTGTDTAWEVGALAGANGALCFGVSNAGHVVGSSMQFQGSGMPFVWTEAGGIQPVPLPEGTSQGSARDANSDGWVVGTASSAYAIPFLNDGEATYRLHDLLPEDSGWDLQENTFSSAEGISEDGLIVGSGVYQGDIRAYAMIPDDAVPTLLQEFTATGRPEGIALRWTLWLDTPELTVALQRARTATGPWQPVTAGVQRDGRTASLLDTATAPGETWHYRLAVSGAGGEPLVMGSAAAARVTVGGLGVVLGAPAPNPTRSTTTVAYRLAASQPVRVLVHDVRGRLVRTLVDGPVAAGDHSLQWDGRRADGMRAPAGVYFLTLQAAQASRTQRVVLTR